MIRRLAILRHAKSSWGSGATSDHARPLNERGIRTAPLVGEKLVSLGWSPDFILSSDSLRTRMTVEGILRELDIQPPTRFTGELYHPGVDDVRRALPTVDDAVQTVLLVGHNPGWEQLVHWLSGEHVVMKTADCALLVGEGRTWEAAVATRSDWELEKFLRSREL